MRLVELKNGVVENVIDAEGRVGPWADWPEVTSEVGPGWSFDGSDFVPPVVEARPPSRDDVNRERDRRVEVGLAITGLGTFQFDSKSRENINGAATLAGFAIAGGAQAGNLRWHGGSSDFSWIMADNAVITMDAQTTFALGQAAANQVSRCTFAGRAIKELDPIPLDYADDKYWPD